MDPSRLFLLGSAASADHCISSMIDMCELARNSCVQSGFEMEVKRHWLGPDWYKPGVEGNLIHKTNVPSMRVEYRHTTLMEEVAMVCSVSCLHLVLERVDC